LVPIHGGGRLRSDAAAAWNTARLSIMARGGTIDVKDYNSTRGLSFRKHTGGNSLFSFHYASRAIDITQALAGGQNQRYFVVKEMIGSSLYWRIYCIANKQNGCQGTKILRSQGIKYYSFYTKKEYALKKGYYIDITQILEHNGFTRIKAHSDWKTNPLATEWWHYHYTKNIQATFQDELELVGFDEQTLRNKGWNTDAQLDHPPG